MQIFICERAKLADFKLLNLTESRGGMQGCILGGRGVLSSGIVKKVSPVKIYRLWRRIAFPGWLFLFKMGLSGGWGTMLNFGLISCEM